MGYSPQGRKEPYTTEGLNINGGINIYIKLKSILLYVIEYLLYLPIILYNIL